MPKDKYIYLTALVDGYNFFFYDPGHDVYKTFYDRDEEFVPGDRNLQLCHKEKSGRSITVEFRMKVEDFIRHAEYM